MTTPQKHAEFIHAWADGAEIEYLDLHGAWYPAHNPDWNWDEDTTFRIKPKPTISAHATELIYLYHTATLATTDIVSELDEMQVHQRYIDAQNGLESYILELEGLK